MRIDHREGVLEIIKRNTKEQIECHDTNEWPTVETVFLDLPHSIFLARKVSQAIWWGCPSVMLV
jgi:hypothetical protein